MIPLLFPLFILKPEITPVMVRSNLFSVCATFSKKLTFLISWYAHLHAPNSLKRAYRVTIFYLPISSFYTVLLNRGSFVVWAPVSLAKFYSSLSNFLKSFINLPTLRENFILLFIWPLFKADRNKQNTYCWASA